MNACGPSWRSPLALHVAYDLTDFEDGLPPALGELNSPEALVVRVGLTDQVAELLELTEQVVQPLLGHSRPGGELRGTGVVGSWVLEDV